MFYYLEHKLFVITIGKPPALPGDSQSSTFPERALPYVSATTRIHRESFKKARPFGIHPKRAFVQLLANSDYVLLSV
jgi:hypothetical protein